jgi:DNA polymerase V
MQNVFGSIFAKIFSMELEALEEIRIPFFTNRVQAGFPSPAMDYMEERIDLNKELIKHPLATFIVECEGTSMINAFIPPRANLLVDRSLTPKNGDIVLAVVNGEFTVKFLKKNEYKCFLVPANKKYQEIEVTGEMEMQVWGVVTSIIIDPNDVKGCML